MQTEALAFLSRLSFDGKALPKALCLYQADWHQGVIGILAGRVKELYHRPVIAFAQGDDHQLKVLPVRCMVCIFANLLDEVSTPLAWLNFEIWWPCHGGRFDYRRG